jgi:hypothetical protein
VTTTTDTKGDLSAKLKNSWIRYLHGRHDQLLDYLELDGWAKKKMAVTIVIVEGGPHWGYYDPRNHAIGLNLRLFESFPWTTIQGFFEHETAHQAGAVLYPRATLQEGPHGPTFRYLCQRMGVNPVFANALVDEDVARRPPNPYGPQKELEPNPILLKVQKLLALSSSPEPGEAQAALAAASRLMAKHNLKLVEESQAETDFERWVLLLGSARLSPKAHLICQILNRHFFVKAIFVYHYDHLADRLERAIEILGRPVNLFMAEHVFHFLMERTETLWSYHKPLAWVIGEKGAGAKSAFVQGLLLGFLRKLDDAEKTAQTTEGLASSEVILSSDARLEKFYRECFPRIRFTSSRPAANNSPFSRQAGVKAGQELTIHPPLARGGGDDKSLRGYLE